MISPASASIEPAPRRLSRRAKLVAGSLLLACLAGVLLVFADVPVARWCKTADLPSEVRRLISMTEVFGFGLSVAVLLVCVLVLDRSWWQRPDSASASGGDPRWAFARLVLATYAGGLLVNAIKICVVRIRPRAADLASIASAWDTFSASCLVEPLGSRSDLMGFPSGHAATAAGLAAALSWRYPHGAILFGCLACAAALQRVTSLAHYPSDVALGAAIGLLGAALVLPRNS